MEMVMEMEMEMDSIRSLFYLSTSVDMCIAFYLLDEYQYQYQYQYQYRSLNLGCPYFIQF